jgi:hypothetical protein
MNADQCKDSTDRVFGNFFPSTCRQHRDPGMLVGSQKASTLNEITLNRSHIYIYIYIYIYALFRDQSGYSIVRPRTDGVPAERLVSYTSGEANFIKISDVQAVYCFMSDIQTPPILEHQRTMVSDQTGIEAHPLSCPLGA